MITKTTKMPKKSKKKINHILTSKANIIILKFMKLDFICINNLFNNPFFLEPISRVKISMSNSFLLVFNFFFHLKVALT
jgi:hypothetical protein